MKPSTLILLPFVAAVSAQLNMPHVHRQEDGAGLLPIVRVRADKAAKGQASATGGGAKATGGAGGAKATGSAGAAGGAKATGAAGGAKATGTGSGAGAKSTSGSTATGSGSGATSTPSTVATSGANAGQAGVNAWGVGVSSVVTIVGMGVSFALFL